MDRQAYPLTNASNSVALKTRSPSICRSESASLRLDTGSILSVTDSKRTISTVESSTLSEYFSFRSKNIGSSTSLADSIRTVTKPEGRFEGAKKYGKSKRKASGGAVAFWKGASVKQVKIDDLSPDDIIIAVMGPTGSGKSTFINIIAGVEIGVGHNAESCTSEISTIRLAVPELTYGDLVFMDTPGFDNTNKSDVDILKVIAEWLNSIYAKEILLAGLFYFHRISDNRMAGTPLRNLRMFEELCGKNAFQNVILVTTMWDEIDEETGNIREQELKSKYWRAMLMHGSTTSRFMRTRESAFAIIDPFIEVTNKRISVLLQQEMVDMRRQLHATSAGHELLKMEFLLRQRQDLLDRIRNEMKRTDGDKMALEPLQLEYEKLQINLEAAVNEMRQLKLPLGKRLLKTTEKFFGIKFTFFKSMSFGRAASKGQLTRNDDSAADAKHSQIAASHQSPPDSIPHTPSSPTSPYVNVDKEPFLDQNPERRDQVEPTGFECHADSDGLTEETGTPNQVVEDRVVNWSHPRILYK